MAAVTPVERSDGLAQLLARLRAAESLQTAEAISLGNEISQLVEGEADLGIRDQAAEAYQLIRDKISTTGPDALALVEPSLEAWEWRVSQPVGEARARELMSRLGKDRINALNQRIDSLYDQITAEKSNDPVISDLMLALRQARDKELEDPRQYDEAEYLVNVAQYQLTRQRQVREDLRAYGKVIASFAVVWVAISLVGMFLAQEIAKWFVDTFYVQGPEAASITASLLRAALVGGLGGAIGTLYWIGYAVSRRDFDRQYTLAYIIKPFLGLILGLIVYLAIRSALEMFMPQTFASRETPGAEVRMVTEQLAWLIAFLIGLRTEYVFYYLEKGLTVLSRQGTERDN